MLRIKMPGGKPMLEAMDVEPTEDVQVEDVAAEPEMVTPMGYVDQTAARYFGPDSICQVCTHFLEPDACEVVAGVIDPAGRCSLFNPDELEEPIDEESIEDVEVSPEVPVEVPD